MSLHFMYNFLLCVIKNKVLKQVVMYGWDIDTID